MTQPGNGDDWRPLYVSAVIGGSTARNRTVRAAVHRFGALVDEVDWTPADDEAAVDMEFHVPGNLLQPDYEGTRTGRWSRTSRVLVMQCAIPEALQDESEDEITNYLARQVADAITMAENHLAKKRNKLPIRQARSIAQEVASTLGV